MGTVIEILATVVDILFLIWFVPKFNGTSLKNRPIALIFPAFLLAFQLLADRLIGGTDLLYAIVMFALALCFSFTLEKKKRLWHVFSTFLYIIVIMLSGTLVFSIFSLFTENFGDMVFGKMSYVRLIYILVCKVTHFAFYRLLLLIFKKEQRIDLKNSVLSFAFTILTALDLVILLEIVSIFNFENMSILITLLALSLIILNIMLYVMIRQVQNLMRSKYELMLIQERMDFDRARAEEAAAIWESIKKIKHDIKNHFVVLNGKLDQGDMCACKDYISGLSQTVESMGNIIQSGNSVIDYLINSKLSSLNDVQVLVSGYVGNYSDIEDADLACMLGNILDNAVEAQEKVLSNKRIELHFLQKNMQRIIICKNTISEPVLENNRMLKSTKHFSNFHGLGHQIVESTVNKYNGLINYFEEEGMFGVQIMLPITRNE